MQTVCHIYHRYVVGLVFTLKDLCQLTWKVKNPIICGIWASGRVIKGRSYLTLLFLNFNSGGNTNLKLDTEGGNSLYVA